MVLTNEKWQMRDCVMSTTNQEAEDGEQGEVGSE